MISDFAARRQSLWVQFIAIVLVLLSAGYAQAADPLPSWNDGKAKSAILDYVTRVTTPGSPDFVPVSERIAVFDNDGTLWPENPMPFQMAFAVDEAKRHAAADPKIAADPMVKALLAGDFDTLMAGPHHEGLLQIINITHSGMTTDEFRQGRDGVDGNGEASALRRSL